MGNRHEITRADIMDMEAYGEIRRARRQEVSAIKKDRRVEVGPFAAFYFENYDTMWYQIHEMLYIEKGGEAQIADELSAYNPMIPDGGELVTTLMFEIEDEDRRKRELGRLGGVEGSVSLSVGGETIGAIAETDVERSKPDGRTSSVHFLHFPFTPAQVASFRTEGARVVLAIGHENYAHMAVLPEWVRAALAADFN
ncbi:MAG: DUF3501 family protein [Proteobacteria bacterium]|nr:DUF3501 family protein [Pseudomonadota bacterium]